VQPPVILLAQWSPFRLNKDVFVDLKAGRELVRFAAIGIESAVRRAFSADDAGRFLSQSLGEIPGAPAKIAQLMGMRSFKEIPSPPPMNINEVKTIISKECPELSENLEEISAWAKTASLGQTHQARLKSGEIVAIKIQYPEVVATISAQVDAIFGVAGFSPARKYDFDVGSTRIFLRQKLLEETDYRMEQQNQLIFHNRYRGSAIVIPSTFEQFSTSKILTQTWEESISLASFSASSSVDQKNTVAGLFTAWLLDSMFGLGVMHSDLNPSNYGFRLSDDGIKLVVYDFGTVTSLPSKYSANFYHWIEATRREDEESVKLALSSLGFSSSKLQPISKKLLPLSRAIFKPIFQQEFWMADQWCLQDALDEILGQDKWWFRTAGPPWFMYLMRSIQGWHHALLAMGVGVDFQKIWAPWQEQLRFLAVAYPLVSSASFSGPLATVSPSHALVAKSLKVRVKEGDETIVELSLPAGALTDLEDLLPESVKLRCEHDGIRLDLIRQKALDSGSVPQELFLAENGPRSYEVWLE